MEIMEMDAHIQGKEGMSIKEIFAVNGRNISATAKKQYPHRITREKAHGCLLRRRRAPQREKTWS